VGEEEKWNMEYDIWNMTSFLDGLLRRGGCNRVVVVD